MLTKSYGGKCPVCGFDRILMRWGSTEHYQFDACPKCGFAYATNGRDIEDKWVETWNKILKNDGDLLKEQGFPITIDGMYKWLTSIINPKLDKSRETVFAYSDKYIMKFKKSKFYKDRMKLLNKRDVEKVVFT